jgi:hypothetical protein
VLLFHHRGCEITPSAAIPSLRQRNLKVNQTTGPITCFSEDRVRTVCGEWSPTSPTSPTATTTSPSGRRTETRSRSSAAWDATSTSSQSTPTAPGLEQLSTTRGNDAHFAWSPDGSRILFTSGRIGFKDEALLTGNPQPYGEIFVMNADGSHIEQLTDNQYEDGGPAWQPAKPTPSTATVAVH